MGSHFTSAPPTPFEHVFGWGDLGGELSLLVIRGKTPTPQNYPSKQHNPDLQTRQCRSTERVTLGITAQSSLRARIEEGVYDLDVGSGHPNGVAAIKGSVVQRLKPYVI